MTHTAPAATCCSSWLPPSPHAPPPPPVSHAAAAASKQHIAAVTVDSSSIIQLELLPPQQDTHTHAYIYIPHLIDDLKQQRPHGPLRIVFLDLYNHTCTNRGTGTHTHTRGSIQIPQHLKNEHISMLELLMLIPLGASTSTPALS